MSTAALEQASDLRSTTKRHAGRRPAEPAAPRTRPAGRAVREMVETASDPMRVEWAGLHLPGNVEGFLGAGSRQKWREMHGLEHPLRARRPVDRPIYAAARPARAANVTLHTGGGTASRLLVPLLRR